MHKTILTVEMLLCYYLTISISRYLYYVILTQPIFILQVRWVFEYLITILRCVMAMRTSEIWYQKEGRKEGRRVKSESAKYSKQHYKMFG